jgi:hypothetical protein
VGWVLALAVLVALVYVAWESRWYLRTLNRTWSSEAELDEAETRREPEPAGRPRSS